MACKLANMGLEVTLIGRGDAPGLWRQQIRQGQTQRTQPLLIERPESLSRGQIQGLLVTTKANQAVDAIAGVATALGPGAPVVLLHNGMGVLEALAEEHPRMTLLAGSTTEGAYLAGDVLVHAGIGETAIGGNSATPPGWFAPFAAGGERFSWSPDIAAVLWQKLLINCAINPLTAIHRCANGELQSDPVLAAEVEHLCAELATVSRARTGIGDNATILQSVRGVIAATAANRSSMLRDVERGRETEIEHINGYLVAEAHRVGVPCPRNKALLAQVRALDSASLSN